MTHLYITHTHFNVQSFDLRQLNTIIKNIDGNQQTSTCISLLGLTRPIKEFNIISPVILSSNLCIVNSKFSPFQPKVITWVSNGWHEVCQATQITYLNAVTGVLQLSICTTIVEVVVFRHFWVQPCINAINFPTSSLIFSFGCRHK